MSCVHTDNADSVSVWFKGNWGGKNVIKMNVCVAGCGVYFDAICSWCRCLRAQSLCRVGIVRAFCGGSLSLHSSLFEPLVPTPADLSRAPDGYIICSSVQPAHEVFSICSVKFIHDSSFMQRVLQSTLAAPNPKIFTRIADVMQKIHIFWEWIHLEDEHPWLTDVPCKIGRFSQDFQEDFCWAVRGAESEKMLSLAPKAFILYWQIYVSK